MIAALQDELSRQMHMTAQAVQSARQYKEALRTNDRAYTQLFGMGVVMPGEALITPEKLEARLASLSAGKAASPREAGAVQPGGELRLQVAPGMTAGQSPAARLSAPVVAGVRQPLTPGLAQPTALRRAAGKKFAGGQLLMVPRCGASMGGAGF